MEQLNLFDELTLQPLSDDLKRRWLTDLFQAYYDARRNKRNTLSALNFEINYERYLFDLHEEIINRRYEIRPSDCFISFDPVQREIFAAQFRDRIVHHLIYNAISPIFERTFIYDSYSCRVGKGTLCGIQRIQRFIRSCSQNYKQDCFILKLDIKGYFMSIDRQILFSKIREELERYTDGHDDFAERYDTVLYLIRRVIDNDPRHDCIVKGSPSDWNGLPPTKSLYHSSPGCGLPIGNLTSQLFSNIYLNEFDHYVKRGLRIHNYGRYVDDFILIHHDKEYLKSLIPVIRMFLERHLKLTLHPAKIYLQHFSKGVSFLGTVIKPYRTYIKSRTKGNIERSVGTWNRFIEEKSDKRLTKAEETRFLSSVNSYLGLVVHFNTFKFRKAILTTRLTVFFWNHVYIAAGFKRLVSRNRSLAGESENMSNETFKV